MMQRHTVGHKMIYLLSQVALHIWWDDANSAFQDVLKKSVCDKILIGRENLKINYYSPTFRSFSLLNIPYHLSNEISAYIS